jgi:general secretion pathway protein E
VLAVVAQRLVRVLCSECKEAFRPDPAALAPIGLNLSDLGDRPIYRAHGCESCFQTGYRGRLGIFEIMELDDTLKSLVLQTFDSHQIKAAAVARGMVTLRRDGIQKVLDGITTVEEVLRVTQR